MKQIKQEQIEQILATLMELNIPVKVYAGMQDLFTKLPDIQVEEPKNKIEKVV